MRLNELIAQSGLAVRDDSIFHAGDGTRSLYLHAGQLIAAIEPTQITTVLGSCVAICVWDPKLRIGGMNHYMLPMNPAANDRAERFADTATAALFSRLIALGVSASRLEAKVFGGASVLGIAGSVLGQRNVLAARQQLAERSVPIVAEDVGGNKGRKLVFRTDTGFSTVKIV